MLNKLIQRYKFVKEAKKYGVNVELITECIKFRNRCVLQGTSFKEALEQMSANQEKTVGELKSEMVAELDKTIISICKGIQDNFVNAELVKSLADLVEVRTCMPDWKGKLGIDIPE